MALGWGTWPALGSEPLTPLARVTAQIEAFNRHDADALAAGVAPDFVWFSVTSDATTVESRGREELRSGMRTYFRGLPDVSSKIEHLAVAGNFVSCRETVSWTSKKGPRRQSCLTVYEVRDGLIFRVWYFPVAR